MLNISINKPAEQDSVSKIPSKKVLYTSVLSMKSSSSLKSDSDDADAAAADGNPSAASDVDVDAVTGAAVTGAVVGSSV
jgi:hypothetical protein